MTKAKLEVSTITASEASPDRGQGLARDMRVRWALEEVGKPYEVRRGLNVFQITQSQAKATSGRNAVEERRRSKAESFGCDAHFRRSPYQSFRP